MGESSAPRKGTKALELWCRRVTNGYPNVHIENMTTSWRDGLAFCAMIHKFRPDLIDFENLDKNNVFENNDLAFRTAEKYLGIPALLEACDMMELEVPDRLSILTYLSQYYRTFGHQDSTSPERKIASPTNKPSPIPRQHTSELSPSPIKKMNSSFPQPSPRKIECCIKCGLAVFLAERIFYKNVLYHNSCFKCTRCAVQLIPGSLVITFDEVTKQLSCKSCSDKSMGMLLFDDDFDGQESNTEDLESQKNTQIPSSSSSSATDNYKAYTTPDLDIMGKSLSDEEKRKSLKVMLDARIGSVCVDDPNSAENDDNSNSDEVDDDDDDDDDGDVNNSVEVDNLKEDTNDNSIIKQSKFDENKTQYLSHFKTFATQLLLVDDNTNTSEYDKHYDTNPVVDENLDLKTDEKIIANCFSSDADDNNLNVANSNLDKHQHASNEIAADIKNDSKLLPVVDDDTAGEDNDDNKVVDNNIKKQQICDDKPCINFESKKMIMITDDYRSIKDEATIKTESKPLDVISIENEEEKKEDVTDDKYEEIIEEIPAVANDISDHTKNEVNSCVGDTNGTNDQESPVKNTRDTNNSCEDENLKPEVEVESNKSVAVVPVLNVVETTTDEETARIDDTTKESASSKNQYPTELNPFGNEEEENSQTSGANKNPFDDDDGEQEENLSSINSLTLRPKQRQSTNPFDDDDDDDSHDAHSSATLKLTPIPAPRRSLANQNQGFHGSNQSIGSISRHKKGRAPLPPNSASKYLSPSSEAISDMGCSSLDSSIHDISTCSRDSTPKMRKKRPAPTPPIASPNRASTISRPESPTSLKTNQRRVISIDPMLINGDQTTVSNVTEENDEPKPLQGQRKIAAPDSEITAEDDDRQLSQRQMEKLKDNKEAKNRNRKSTELTDWANNKWRHTKGPAPPLPIMRISMKHELSNQEINHELEIIKVQQSGLEKQGVMLEKMIRSRSEDEEGVESVENNGSENMNNDIDDLMMQLFEIVNEKNELFRRQAELLNLRRQYRLEQEYADLEYKIRQSMAQPERNKTDSDKEQEDALVARLIHVVEQRNEVIECFEMDRLREREEDMSIKKSLEMHSAKRDSQMQKQHTLTKLSKKEKKKLKETLKFGSHKKSNKKDVDKDEDETEIPPTSTPKSKKSKFIKFSSIIKHS